MPRILPRTKLQRATGLERSKSTVPLRISRATVLLAQSTAITSPKSSPVAIELSTTSLSCSENTKIDIDG